MPHLVVSKLSKVRKAVSLAKQLDKAAHLECRANAGASLRRRLAQEMDLPSDSDDDDRDGRDAVDEVARRAAARKKQQAVAQRAELKRLLGRLDRPSGGASIADVAAAARSGVTWTG